MTYGCYTSHANLSNSKKSVRGMPDAEAGDYTTDYTKYRADLTEALLASQKKN